MRISMKTKRYPLLALALLVGAFLFVATAAAPAAAAGIEEQDLPATERLSVDEVWLTGDTLHIAVTDKNTGEGQKLALNLSEYAKPSDEYITVQATDSSGQTSNSIQFKNPYYAQQGNTKPGHWDDSPGQERFLSESAIPEGENPFTPAGTGTVIDNVTDGGGKEFLTVETPDGNVFYLIVDRQRNTDNVYLLNAVTEDDLASLAKPGNGKNVSAVETPAVPAPVASPEITPEPKSEPEPTSPPVQKGSGNTGTILFIVIAVAGVGGAGYYLKIVRPKKLGIGDDDDYADEPDEFGDNEEIDVYDDYEEDDV